MLSNAAYHAPNELYHTSKQSSFIPQPTAIQLAEVGFRSKKLLILQQGVVIANLLSNHPLYKYLGFEHEIRAQNRAACAKDGGQEFYRGELRSFIEFL